MHIPAFNFVLVTRLCDSHSRAGGSDSDRLCNFTVMSDGAIILGIVTAAFVTFITRFIYAYFSSQRKHTKLRNEDSPKGYDYFSCVLSTHQQSSAFADMKDAKSVEKVLDPVDYCDHIQREVKLTKQKAALKEIQSHMSEEQVEEERQTQKKQLEEIFKLMAEQKEHFGINSVDDVQDQMKLYM